MKKINKLQAQNCAVEEGGLKKKNNKNLNKNCGAHQSAQQMKIKQLN